MATGWTTIITLSDTSIAIDEEEKEKEVEEIEVEEEVTLDEQFAYFARLFDENRSGKTMTLWRSDYWLRQAKIIDDRHVTVTDTGLIWFKSSIVTEKSFNEWRSYLKELCDNQNLDLDYVEDALTNCGAPGTVNVTVPEYRSFYTTYKPKLQLIY